ncbi:MULTISPECIES: hypothetical protein [Pseudomonas]
MDAYFYGVPTAAVHTPPFLAVLQQLIRLDIHCASLRPPLSSAARLVQSFAAFPLVTIGMTTPKSPATAMQMIVPQPRE